jgi:phosphoglucosamine mutase
MKRNFFGTDGIRGVPNTEPLTLNNVVELGRAVSYILRDKNSGRKGKVLIGRDTRSSGYMLGFAMATGIVSMGLDVFFVGALPTPAIAFLAKDMRADMGVIISASHNPYMYNGIKVFNKDGFKLKDELEHKIEKLMFSKELNDNFAKPQDMGMVTDLHDAKSRYIVFAKKSFPRDLSLKGMKIVLDSANGAAYDVGPTIFDELGADVVSVNDKPNGININEESGALYPEKMASLVKKHKANIGITLDGDADRVILIDEKGSIVDGDFIMAMIAINLKKQKKLSKDSVVVTPMSNFGFNVAMKEKGINVVEADVGDRYVVEEMKKNDYNFGGEQSGHIIFLDHTTTGDGIIASLQVLSYMLRENKPLSELTSVMKKYPQVLKNIEVKNKVPFSDIKGLYELKKEIESDLEGKGRVFLRYSGTEPIARVMLEGEDLSKITNYADKLCGLIEKGL